MKLFIAFLFMCGSLGQAQTYREQNLELQQQQVDLQAQQVQLQQQQLNAQRDQQNDQLIEQMQQQHDAAEAKRNKEGW